MRTGLLVAAGLCAGCVTSRTVFESPPEGRTGGIVFAAQSGSTPPRPAPVASRPASSARRPANVSKRPAPAATRESGKEPRDAPGRRDPHGAAAAHDAPRAAAATGGAIERVHVVRRGENMFRIALRFGLTTEALARHNRISDPRKIRVGQRLRIPPAPTAAAAGTAGAAEKAAAKGTTTAAETRRGTTARRRPAPAAEIRGDQGVGSRAGERAEPRADLEPSEGEGTGTVDMTGSAVDEAHADGGADTAVGDSILEVPPPGNVVIEETPGDRPPFEPGPGDDRPAAEDNVPVSVWTWPIGGPVASRYGARGHDGWHAGIDVTAPIGTVVRAARAGTVSFAGRQGRYGRLVVIDHGDGTTSWYAHLARDVVHEGERVRQGEVIGRSGRSGNATGPHLHFEIRYDGTPVDPLPFLEGGDSAR